MRPQLSVPLAALLALAPASSHAEVSAANERGFFSHNEVLVRATPAEAWAAMVRPADWWNGDHSYSGDPANLTIAPSAGGCFCETIPAKDGAPAGQVEHMRVIYVAPGSTLRLSGGLGPLQSEPVNGVLTMTLTPDGEMTRITWDYAVGGYLRTPAAEIAPLVDQVVGEQLLRLAASLGRRMDPALRRAP
jgi:hypothetical protein